jgi:rhodanese-related sulfurtransferase
MDPLTTNANIPRLDAALTMKTARTAPPATYRGQPVDVVIDVRTKLEFWLGHLDHAICIPVDTIATELPKRVEIGKGARILLYCASGARSQAAAAQLTLLGYRNVIDGGGMSAAAAKYSA